MRRWASRLLALLFLAAPRPAFGQTYLLIVSGIGGEPRYSADFFRWSTSLAEAATARYGLAEENVIVLADSGGPGVTIDGRSTKEAVERAVRGIAQRAAPSARLFIVLIGHGSASGDEARFNLPGRDMTAHDFAALLEWFPTQEIVFANLSSASGDFVPILSGERRVVVTATKSGFERNQTFFPRFFVDAWVSEGADTDKDERVSVLEAFDYARREVARHYERDNTLQTEHALLDDNGDGRGSTEPVAEGGDGALARGVFLDSGPLRAVAAGVAEDTVLIRLYRRREALENKLAVLRTRKDAMAPETYERELERLLVELATVGRAIRERENREPR
ncbi:MAG: hypothetical protein ACE5PT_04085 [Gemmatimonadales bacterium]